MVYCLRNLPITIASTSLAAGTPVAYGRILEWKGRPEVDICWGDESALFDKLAEQKLLVRLDLPKAVMDAIPAIIGKPKPIYLKDPRGFWTGTVLKHLGANTGMFAAGFAVPSDMAFEDRPTLLQLISVCAASLYVVNQFGDTRVGGLFG